MKALTFFTATIIASTVGVAVGMLFAPQKGSKTRRKIAEKNHQYTDYLNDRFDDFIDTVSHPFENAEDEIQRLADKAKAEARAAKGKVVAKVNSSL
jgi:gas vesicle protein